MKKNYFIFVLFFYQIDSVGAQIDYVDYSKAVIIAEDKFLNSDFYGSIAEYKKIFNKYPNSLLKDHVIAAEIAFLSQNKYDGIDFLDMAFRKGLTIEAAEKIVVFRKFLSSGDEQANKVRKNYSSNRDFYLSSVNFDYRHKVLVMIKEDDCLTKVPDEWQTKRYRDSLYDAFGTRILHDLTFLYNNIGFPGNRLLGVADSKMDYSCSDECDLYLCSRMDILFLHTRCAFSVFERALQHALHSGDLDPRIYAFLYESSKYDPRRQNRESFRHHPSSFDCSTHQFAASYNICDDVNLFNKNIKFVDSCRNKIGIASVQHDNDKKAFEAKYNVRLFFGKHNKY